MHILGVDTGGTFTDFVLSSPKGVQIHKVLSTPAAPEQAILRGIQELGLDPIMQAGDLMIIHGSTVATNAALENKGARTAYITNQGLEDVLTIGRQTRAKLYDLQPTSQPIPVLKELCFGISGRLSASGELIESLDDNEIATLVSALRLQKPEAIAINLLFSFLNPEQEKRLETALNGIAYTSRSSAVLPEYKEYERGIATWLNASLGPLVSKYLTKLQSGVSPSQISMMQSTGGTSDLASAANNAVKLLLSGPAGGLAGAKYIAGLANCMPLVTFDMGGTSTDVALIDGDLTLTSEGRIGPYPVAVPMADMHTIGAGGGSIAAIDEGGLLTVGPESAGSYPGPACYGQAKENLRATVTDANAVLGRLRPNHFLGGTMTLDLEAAKQAISPIAEALQCSLEEAAEGIIRLANDHMTRALRVISVERGYDTTGFHLCCFGGAGGLHVCALADQLKIRQALVPVHGGVLSALGMLVAPKERQLSITHRIPLSECDFQQVEKAFQSLAKRGFSELSHEGVASQQVDQHNSVDLRYQGQSFTLNIKWIADLQTLTDAFHEAHAKRFGHSLASAIEIVNLRVALKSQQKNFQLPNWVANGAANSAKATAVEHALIYHPLSSNKKSDVPIYERKALGVGQTITGPALVVEQVSTTWIEKDWQAKVDSFGNLLLQKLAGK